MRLAALSFVLALAWPLVGLALEEPQCPGGTSLGKESGGSRLMFFCQRRDGTRHGPYLVYFTSTDKIQERGEYLAGNYHGTYSRYDTTTGKVLESGTYREGQQHGWWTTYHANGKVEWSGEMSFGSKRGRWSRYNEKGVLTEDGEYRKGYKHGFWRTYDPKTSKILKETDFVDGAERAKR